MLEEVEKGLLMQKLKFRSEGWAEAYCTSKASETVLFMCKVSILMYLSKSPSVAFTITLATIYPDDQPYAQNDP